MKFSEQKWTLDVSESYKSLGYQANIKKCEMVFNRSHKFKNNGWPFSVRLRKGLLLQIKYSCERISVNRGFKSILEEVKWKLSRTVLQNIKTILILNLLFSGHMLTMAQF